MAVAGFSVGDSNMDLEYTAIVDKDPTIQLASHFVNKINLNLAPPKSRMWTNRNRVSERWSSNNGVKDGQRIPTKMKDLSNKKLATIQEDDVELQPVLFPNENRAAIVHMAML
jgi:hypothetical protein